MSLYTWEDVEDLAAVDPIIHACFTAYRDLPREEMLVRIVIELADEKARLFDVIDKLITDRPVVIKLENRNVG